MTAMAIKSLFDEKRKQELKEGLAKGKLDLRRRKPMGQDVDDETTREYIVPPDEAAKPGLPLSFGDPAKMYPPPLRHARLPNPFAPVEPMAEGPMGAPVAKSASPSTHKPEIIPFGILDSVTEALFEAIKANDYFAAQAAINGGALVNCEATRGYDHPITNPEDTVEYSLQKTKPLALARELGRPEIENLLLRHGARM